MGLPAELRIQIIEQFCLSHMTSTVRSPVIARICRGLRDEAFSIWFETNQFTIQIYCPYELDSTTRTDLGIFYQQKKG
jgi:hypothetical protein